MTDWQKLNELAQKGKELTAAIRKLNGYKKYCYPVYMQAQQEDLVHVLTMQFELLSKKLLEPEQQITDAV